MPWQDWVFFLGGFVILVSMLPTIRGPQKPELMTCLISAVLIAIFTVTMATLGLWLSAVMNGLMSGAWALLALQRHRQESPAHRERALAKIREELLDSDAAGGS